ncbi:MAG: Maf family protein [Rickettsiales bacterium]
MTILQTEPLVLASGSSIRQSMLKSVGLNFSVIPSGVDEEAIKNELKAAPIAELAQALARAKTLSVSMNNPDAYTIGADQICEVGGTILSKPGSYERAEVQLAGLAGKAHTQHCAMTLARGEEIIWEHHETASLTMRSLSAEEIHAYVAVDAPLASCGAYKFEGLGRHLFASVVGDHDVVQGLALVPLLAQLHTRGIITLA